jgi:hypothetical protein
MTTVTATYRDGRVAQLENIYIRGSKIRSEPEENTLSQQLLSKALQLLQDKNLRTIY